MAFIFSLCPVNSTIALEGILREGSRGRGGEEGRRWRLVGKGRKGEREKMDKRKGKEGKPGV